MGRIVSINPQPLCRLEVCLDTGSIVTLNLAPRLKTARFSRLSDELFFRSATTDGTFIRWGSSIEISLHEVFQLAED